MSSEPRALLILRQVRPLPSCPRRHRLWPVALLFAVLSSGMGSAVSETNNAPNGTEGEDSTQIRISVPYVTNRLMEADGPRPEAYGGERGTPSVGRCEVQFQPIPIIDKIAPRVPFYVADETRKVRFQRETNQEVFWERLEAEVAGTASGSLVVFVHGYNYGFERHCTVAAELQRTLQGKALVLMFSWPSNARPSDYIPDQADVEWSVSFLAHTLAQLADRLGPEQMQVLAHSLGSRGVIFALERLRAEREQRPLIGPLVLMAPDFDAQTFVERLPELATLTGGITLYASSNDTPLKVSRQLHASPRLGEAGEFLTAAEDMQTIDVSPLGRYQVLGHEYFLFHPRVAADLAVLLAEGRDATQRKNLRAMRRKGLIYWELRGDTDRPDDGAR